MSYPPPLYDGDGEVPPGGLHGFRNESGARASMLLHFAPGAPREPYFEGLNRLAAGERWTPEEYDAVTQTRIHSLTWDRVPDGYRHFERSIPIGHGPRDWDVASRQVLQWAVKTRSGFAVQSSSGHPGVVEGDDYVLVAEIGPLRIREPVRVVDVVQRQAVCGFAYGTRVGHPVSGEEAWSARSRSDFITAGRDGISTS